MDIHRTLRGSGDLGGRAAYARAEGGQFVLGIRAVPGLPIRRSYVEGSNRAGRARLTGVAVTRAYVDKGYRGHGLETQIFMCVAKPGQTKPDHQVRIAKTLRHRTSYRSRQE
jgi:IS5 family transposase